MTSTQTIQALPVIRDGMGFWTHPQWPSTDDELIPYTWFTDRGLEVAQTSFEYDAPEQLQTAWFDDGVANCTDWTPSKPAGDGWFVFSIHDNDDGPVCIWVRPTNNSPEA